MSNEEEISVPKLTQMPSSNFTVWKRQLLLKIKTDFGEIATELKKKKLDLLDEPDESKVDPKNKIALEKYLADMKEYKSNRARRQKELPQIAGLIVSKISEAALRDLNADKSLKFQENFDKNDIIEMWKAIEQVHFAKGTGSTKYDKLQAKIDFRLTQKPGQSLEGYVLESNDKIEVLTNFEIEVAEEELAFRFIRGLDAKIFGSNIARWMGSEEIPLTLSGAIGLATRTYASLVATNTIPMNTNHIQKVKIPASLEGSSNDTVLFGRKINGKKKHATQIENEQGDTCIWCKKPGHNAQVCRFLKQYVARNGGHENHNSTKRMVAIEHVNMCMSCGGDPFDGMIDIMFS